MAEANIPIDIKKAIKQKLEALWYETEGDPSNFNAGVDYANAKIGELIKGDCAETALTDMLDELEEEAYFGECKDETDSEFNDGIKYVVSEIREICEY